MLHAITRPVSPSLARCELTHLEREPIDVDLARRQHRAYEQTLRDLGCTVHTLPGAPDMPDAVFVEDTVVVLDHIAVITRPGAPSRRGELRAMVAALRPYRELRFIEAPGTLDGGDVLRVGRQLYVGETSRSNRAGINQLAGFAARDGYAVQAVPVAGCLHLKSAVSEIGPDLLLLNPAWTDARAFAAHELIEADSNEPGAGNALLLGAKVVLAEHFPATRARLESRGIAVESVAATEIAKAEGGVTCCSVVFESSAG